MATLRLAGDKDGGSEAVASAPWSIFLEKEFAVY